MDEVSRFMCRGHYSSLTSLGGRVTDTAIWNITTSCCWFFFKISKHNVRLGKWASTLYCSFVSSIKHVCEWCSPSVTRFFMLLLFWLVVVRIISKDAFLSQGAPGPPSKEGNHASIDSPTAQSPTCACVCVGFSQAAGPFVRIKIPLLDRRGCRVYPLKVLGCRRCRSYRWDASSSL